MDLNLNLVDTIAREAFRDKIDKSGKPYLEHLRYVANVASDVKKGAYDKDVFCIGMLHDLLEDCPEWNEKALRQLIPEHIVDAVVVLTKGKDEPYEDYITRVLQNEYAVKVKKADLEHNMDITRLPIRTDKDSERLKK